MNKFKLLSVFSLISVLAFAQQSTNEENLPLKTDSLNSFKFKTLNKSNSSLLHFLEESKTLIIKMPNAKPENKDIYAALKGKVRNDSIFRIPNAFPKNLVLAKK